MWQPGYRKGAEHRYRPDPPIPDGLTGGLRKHEAPAFLWMNFCRYRLLKLLPELDHGRPLGIAFAREILRWAAEAERTKNQIVSANLNLADRISRRTSKHPQTLEDYYQEALLVLSRAIDRFDAARGHRLSTYAWPAIYREMGRQHQAENSRRASETGPYNDQREPPSTITPRFGRGEPGDLGDIRRLLAADSDVLTSQQRFILRKRYGLDGESGQTHTLDQIGRMVGVSKERIRQIQDGALGQLRDRLLLPSALL